MECFVAKTSGDKMILQIFDIFFYEFKSFFKPIEFLGLNKVNWALKNVFTTKQNFGKHSTVPTRKDNLSFLILTHFVHMTVTAYLNYVLFIRQIKLKVSGLSAFASCNCISLSDKTLFISFMLRFFTRPARLLMISTFKHLLQTIIQVLSRSTK